MKAIMGEKLGMTQIFDEESNVIPVTVIKAGPVRVVQVKTEATDGYDAIQIAFKPMKASKANQAQAGHYAKAGLDPYRHLLEVRVDDASGYKPGQEITVGDVFETGTKADVTGYTKGKGFAGVMERHNFKGQGASHGAHRVHRAPGSIGAASTPSRVFRGKRMAGRLGGTRQTHLNLEVAAVDAERNLLMLRGAVPGPKGAVVVIREAVKANA
ncbi:MAG: 50S ribosomal protein L3 [Acidimicrobiia bacterium]|nr:50S ribosomal protein L3 [Acidimicrobiia bacterium]NNK91149.1 50S ribosomal protein L3 [Acidimicrobiia bacterium]